VGREGLVAACGRQGECAGEELGGRACLVGLGRCRWVVALSGKVLDMI
jgi:hypothetical protein